MSKKKKQGNVSTNINILYVFCPHFSYVNYLNLHKNMVQKLCIEQWEILVLFGRLFLTLNVISGRSLVKVKGPYLENHSPSLDPI